MIVPLGTALIARQLQQEQPSTQQIADEVATGDHFKGLFPADSVGRPVAGAAQARDAAESANRTECGFMAATSHGLRMSLGRGPG